MQANTKIILPRPWGNALFKVAGSKDLKIPLSLWQTWKKTHLVRMYTHDFQFNTILNILTVFLTNCWHVKLMGIIHMAMKDFAAVISRNEVCT